MFLKVFNRTVPILLFLTAVWSPLVRGEVPASGILDGASYEGVLREVDATDGGDEDRLVFEGGHFTSRACEDYGFGRTEYAADKAAGQIRFTATATSPTRGMMEWEGAVRGDRIDVRVIWTKKRWLWDTRREYRFEGELVP